MKGTVGGNAKDYGEVCFGEEGLAVVYHIYTHSGPEGIIIS